MPSLPAHLQAIIDEKNERARVSREERERALNSFDVIVYSMSGFSIEGGRLHDTHASALQTDTTLSVTDPAYWTQRDEIYAESFLCLYLQNYINVCTYTHTCTHSAEYKKVIAIDQRSSVESLMACACSMFESGLVVFGVFSLSLSLSL